MSDDEVWNVQSLKEYVDTLRITDRDAVHTALTAATEKAVTHNGLIAQMRELQATFATRDALADLKETLDRRLAASERFQNKVTGALILLGFIGIANLVKVWTG